MSTPWFTHQPIRLRLNYTPGKRWYFFWNDFRLAEVEADFDAMASLGIDHVRVQVIWPWFMPNPGWVSPGHLDRLHALLDIAAARKIDVLLSVLTGFLSGYIYLPWGMGRRDVFTCSEAIQQEKQLFTAILEHVADHPALMGVDLGNEINCLDHSLPTDTGNAWAKDLIAHIHERFPAVAIVNGVDHTPWMAGTTFTLPHLGQDYAACCLHTWPRFTGCLEKGPLDGQPSMSIAAFMVDLARMYAPTDTPIWVQEIGCCDTWGDESARARFLTHSLRSSVRHGARLITWWCSHDKTPDLHFSREEYSYGLLTPDNARKPLAEVFADTLTQLRSIAAASEGIGGNPQRLIVPDDFTPQIVRPWPEGRWLEQNFASNTWTLIEQYAAMAAQGFDPIMVRAGKAGAPRPGDVLVKP